MSLGHRQNLLLRGADAGADHSVGRAERVATPDCRSCEAEGGAPPLPLKLLALVLFLPEEASFSVGGLRLTATRVLLLALTPIVLFKFRQKIATGRYRLVLSDILVPIAGAWMIIGPANIVGIGDALNHSGPVVLEFCIGYLVTRTLLSRQGEAVSYAEFLFPMIAIVALLGIFDPLTDHFFIRDLVGSVTGYSKNFSMTSYDNAHRLGILRACSTLEHPIAYGLICTMGLLLAAYLPSRRRRVVVPACALGVILSITSAALQGVFFAVGLVVYGRLFGRFQWRWQALVGISIAALVLVYITTSDPFGIITRHLILDEQSGDFRRYVWTVASGIVTQSPWFGIGYEIPEQYDLPFSVDSVWLVSALTYGIPGAILIALAIISSASLPTSGPGVGLTTTEKRFGMMLGIIVFLIIFWGFTVHFWGTDWIFISMLIGIRAQLGELAHIRDA